MGINRGYTFGATEQVTNAKLHALVDDATFSEIVNANIASDAAIASTKLADIAGSKLTTLNTITSGAGVIPAANLTSVAQKGSNSDITALTGLSTPISVAQGGTGTTATANTANGIVVLNASSQLPAVSGALLTNLPSAFGAWESKNIGTVYQAATDGFVVGVVRGRQPGGGESYVYTDSSNPPTTARITTVMWDGVMRIPFCVPVKKGDYYKVVSGSETVFVPYAYWIPLGS